MKKWIIGLSVLTLAGPFFQTAYAETQTAEATARVTVASVFSISLDRSDIDFRILKPGQTLDNIPESALRVTTRTNTGNPWELKVNALSPLRNGPDLIPNENFSWHGWSEGKGKWLGTGNDKVSLSPTVAYLCDSTEVRNISDAEDGTHNFFQFGLSVPKSAKPGLYRTIVRFTVTE